MSKRSFGNIFLLVVLAAVFAVPASAYVKHIRYYAPSAEGVRNLNKLAFVMEKSMANPRGAKRYYLEDIEFSLVVNSANNEIDPKLLAQEDSVELAFTADELYWSVEVANCAPKDGLVGKDWLFCSINDDKNGFALEAKPGRTVLHFGKIWQNASANVSVPVTYGEEGDYLMDEKGEDAHNRLLVAGDSAELVSIDLSDALAPTMTTAAVSGESN